MPRQQTLGRQELFGPHPPGQRLAVGLLTECGWTVRRARDTYLAAQFWQIARRRGQERAAVAVGHSILVIAWHILSSPEAVYDELGGDYFTRRIDRARQQRRIIAQLEALGLAVEVKPAA